MNEWTIVETLVRAAQAGDRAAFGELARRFHDLVCKTAKARVRDAHEAEELVQEVFLHAMRKIGQLREPAAFGAWLRMITQRLAINRGTRRPPFATVEAETLEACGKAADTPLEDIVKRESRDRVRAAVAGLKPMVRDALAAFYLQGRSLAEIAAALDIPLGTIKRRLHTARRRLEQSLTGSPVPAPVRRLRELAVA